MEVIGTYLIPILYLYFGWSFLKKKPKYNDQSGFSTKRARESEEIWDAVQHIAGTYCVVAAIVIAAMVYFLRDLVKENNTLFWVRVAVEVGSIALIVPVVNLVTNRKFPKN